MVKFLTTPRSFPSLPPFLPQFWMDERPSSTAAAPGRGPFGPAGAPTTGPPCLLPHPAGPCGRPLRPPGAHPPPPRTPRDRRLHQSQPLWWGAHLWQSSPLFSLLSTHSIFHLPYLTSTIPYPPIGDPSPALSGRSRSLCGLRQDPPPPGRGGGRRPRGVGYSWVPLWGLGAINIYGEA